MKDRHFIIISLIFIAAALAAVIFKSGSKIQLPPATSYQDTQVLGAETESLPLPPEVNLAVPFTSQAPYANWELPYQEFCEEASVLMAASYLFNRGIASAAYADAELLKIKDWEVQTFGYYKDTTAEETAKILEDYFDISKVKLAYNPTLTQIKQAVAAGKLVLVPAAGRMLPNPNYRSPGPLYHMLVIKGYTKDGRLITNDPGTRKGADYVFESNDVMNAMHDWNDGDVNNGQKVVIVVG
ncbi:MAG: C39 family peptidase [Candidatus Doudnabacteria bacterium]|nr:C39 family peptidase [Candidatus Doudnabacteria bacterium]